MTELERCTGFLSDLALRCARRTVESRFGLALLDDELPRVWSLNYVLAERDLDQAKAGELAEEADRLLGAAGLGHRKIEILDGEAGARLAPEFKELGWEVEVDLVMPHRRKPDREVETSRVEEVGYDVLVPVSAAGIRSAPWGKEEETVRQLLAHKEVIAAAVPTRFFAARADGAVASMCDLYSDGRTGQIEAVMTLEPYRNRGLARAVVSRALAESVASGNDVTFLLAHEHDWPKELYRKLGFDAVGSVYEFRKRDSTER